MVRTFYIPNDKRELMEKFVEKAQNMGVSYSQLIVQFMDDYVSNKPHKVNNCNQKPKK